MSWKLMPMLPPQRGIGLALKISRLFSRKSRIQAGSLFISEICATISALEPLAGLEDRCRHGAEIVLVDFAHGVVRFADDFGRHSAFRFRYRFSVLLLAACHAH